MVVQRPSSKGSFVRSMFYEEPPGTFSKGYVFLNAPEIGGDQFDDEIGYWHCDIANNDKLTWSTKVYELFGLEDKSPVDRERAVSRYSTLSQSFLSEVRGFAMRRKCGFILDAEIHPEPEKNRWIRILAVPVLARKRLVGLHGLKRELNVAGGAKPGVLQASPAPDTQRVSPW